MLLRKFYPLFLILFLVFSGVAVQYIPSQPTDTHIKNACEIFKQEKMYPWYYKSILDNYTDVVMLLISSSQPDEPGLKRFLASPFYSISQEKHIKERAYPFQSLCRNKINNRVIYPRYWHGYQIILRPLLYFTDYQNIRLINKFLQPLLFLLLLYFCIKNKAYGLILGIIVSYIAINPLVLPLCMTYSTIYYITTIFSILLLAFKKQIERHIGWPIFFMMIGICTSFFDFFTYPVVALGMPLTILFYVAPAENGKTMMKNLLLIGICWIFGYAGMWALKWVLGTLILDEDVLKDAIESVNYRAESTNHGNNFPMYMPIKNTINFLFMRMEVVISTVCAVLISVATILWKVKKAFEIIKEKYFQILPFFIISTGPILYSLIVRGHTLQHAFFTYRIWVVAIFAIISGLNFWAALLYKAKD